MQYNRSVISMIYLSSTCSFSESIKVRRMHGLSREQMRTLCAMPRLVRVMLDGNEPVSIRVECCAIIHAESQSHATPREAPISQAR